MKARIPNGMGGGPSNLNAMIKQAQKMQEDMAAKQEELDAREYDISAGGGVVGVKINGKREILSIIDNFLFCNMFITFFLKESTVFSNFVN